MEFLAFKPVMASQSLDPRSSKVTKYFDGRREMETVLRVYLVGRGCAVHCTAKAEGNFVLGLRFMIASIELGIATQGLQK